MILVDVDITWKAAKHTVEGINKAIEHTSRAETRRAKVSEWVNFQCVDEDEDDVDNWTNLQGEQWDEL